MVSPRLSVGSVLKHSTVEKDGQTCISQVAVSACLPGSVALSHVTHKVPFTCLSQSNKVAKLYVDKAERGEVLPELAAMDLHHTLPVHMPVRCS